MNYYNSDDSGKSCIYLSKLLLILEAKTFVRLAYAMKGNSTMNELKFVETTNRVFSKLGFELSELEKGKRLWNFNT